MERGGTCRLRDTKWRTRGEGGEGEERREGGGRGGGGREGGMRRREGIAGMHRREVRTGGRGEGGISGKRRDMQAERYKMEDQR